MARPLKRPRPAQGEHLANLRTAAGLSQVALADLVGIPQQTLANWETSDKPPSSDLLPRLAKALRVSVEDILNIKQTKPSKKRGPPSKLAELVEEASKLPRSQQQKIAEFLAALIDQYRRSES